MKIALVFAVASCWAGWAAAQPLAPLAEQSLPYAQDKPLPLAKTSAAEREHNKQVVLDFYHKVGDTRDWSEQSLLKYFDANFIQHDPSEPSTAKAYAQFMGGLVPRTPAGNGQPRTGGAYPMPGSTPKDANNSPVEWLFADGDIVVAVRRRNWDWPGGPESVFNGIFVDVWRVQHAKITEQWCSCTLADARLKHIAEAKAAGYWKK